MFVSVRKWRIAAIKIKIYICTEFKFFDYVTFPRFANSDLRFSSKDFEKLWFLYQTEGVPEEESINSFCEKNGVPYDEFDKWFRKTHQAVGRVEIENVPYYLHEKTFVDGYRFIQVKFTGDGERAYRKDGEYAISNCAADNQ